MLLPLQFPTNLILNQCMQAWWLSSSRTLTLDDAVVGIDFNAYKAKLPVSVFAALTENIRHTRHFGANAPEVCFVAAGLTDAFVDLRQKIRTTDVAASFLIVKEFCGVG